MRDLTTEEKSYREACNLASVLFRLETHFEDAEEFDEPRTVEGMDQDASDLDEALEAFAIARARLLLARTADELSRKIDAAELILGDR